LSTVSAVACGAIKIGLQTSVIHVLGIQVNTSVLPWAIVKSRVRGGIGGGGNEECGERKNEVVEEKMTRDKERKGKRERRLG
jgi:hypothetical protein